jgi:hypothetical protein
MVRHDIARATLSHVLSPRAREFEALGRAS